MPNSSPKTSTAKESGIKKEGVGVVMGPWATNKRGLSKFG